MASITGRLLFPMVLYSCIFGLLTRMVLNYMSFSIPTDKDWEDIKFGVDNQIDFYAIFFCQVC
ncbi:hypothetical protein ACS0TY_001783 [Phlomoides rotata]